jgi:hypothetical protein
MDSDDLPVHDLLGVGTESSPGPDQLRAIVTRAGRRRRRVAAAGMAAALLVGAAVGWAVADHSSSGPDTATATAPAPSTQGPTSSAANPVGRGAAASPAIGVDPAARLTPVATRSAGPVTIRVFRTTGPTPAAVAGGCGVALSTFQIEVSTARMVGTTLSAIPSSRPTQPVDDVESRVVGVAEGNPTAVVTAMTSAKVALVRMSYSGGAVDEMAPIDGMVFLAGPVPDAATAGTAGTLTAVDPAGRTLSTTSVTPSDALGGLAFGCPAICPSTGVLPVPAPAASSPSSASSVAGSGPIAQPAPAPACPVVSCPAQPRIGAPVPTTGTSVPVTAPLSTTVVPGGPDAGPGLPTGASAAGPAIAACPVDSGTGSLGSGGPPGAAGSAASGG